MSIKNRMMRWLKQGAQVVMVTLALSQAATAATPIVMATKSFTEQHILSAMTVMWLQKNGFQVIPKTNIAAIIGRNAMVNKQIDMTWEYTGTSLINFNHIDKPMSSQQAYETVKALDAKLGLVWLNPAPMNNTYAFAMQRSRAQKEGITTMSQLEAKLDQLRQSDPEHNWKLGLDLEFSGRSDGMKPLQKKYNLILDRPQIRPMDPGLVYNAIRDGFVEAGLIYTTDGRVKGFDLQVLEDDKAFFSSYNVTPVVRQEVLESHPGLADALNQLSALISNEVISELNKRVDIDHQSPQQVARDFLKARKML